MRWGSGAVGEAAAGPRAGVVCRAAGGLLGVVLLLVPASAGAQTITGIVVEDGTRARIAGVGVEVISSRGQRVLQAVTDGTGMFTLRLAREGSYYLKLSHDLYAEVRSDSLRLRADELVVLELRMSPAVVPLQPLQVVTQGDPRLLPFYQRMQRGSPGRFLDRSDVEARPGARVTQLLEDLPELAIGRSPDGGSIMSMRSGARTCVPTVYVDGNPFRGDVDAFLMPSVIEGVEIYARQASVPSEYVTTGTCGVVAFWTRPGTRGQGVPIKLVVAGLVAVAAILLAR